MLESCIYRDLGADDANLDEIFIALRLRSTLVAPNVSLLY